MKKVFETIGKLVFYVFVVVVFLWTASLTLAEVREILPGDPLTPFFALALFDGGAVAWLLAWMSHARGLAQRSIALVMLVIDLLGVVLLSAARLFGGGQTLTDAPEMIGAVVIWGIIGATLLNVAAVFAFHIVDPDTMAAIETGVMVDTLRDEALAQAKSNMAAESQTLGAIMAARATAQIKYDLRLPMAANEAQHIIDAQAVNVDQAQPAQAQPGILARWMMTAARKMRRRRPAPAMVANMSTTTAVKDLRSVDDAPPADGGVVDPTEAPTA